MTSRHHFIMKLHRNKVSLYFKSIILGQVFCLRIKDMSKRKIDNRCMEMCFWSFSGWLNDFICSEDHQKENIRNRNLVKRVSFITSRYVKLEYSHK